MTPNQFEKVVSQLDQQYEHQARLKAIDIAEKAFVNAGKGSLKGVLFNELPKGDSLVEKQLVAFLAQHNWTRGEHYRIIPGNHDPHSLVKSLVFTVRNYHGGEIP